MKKVMSLLLSVAMLLTVGVGMEMTAQAATECVYEYGDIKVYMCSYSGSSGIQGLAGNGYTFYYGDSDGIHSNIHIVPVGWEFLQECGSGAYGNVYASRWDVTDRNIIQIRDYGTGYCIIKAVSPGTASIKNDVDSVYYLNGALYDYCIWTYETKILVPDPLTSITLSSSNVSLSIGGTQKLEENGYAPDNALSIYFTPRSYSSSDTSVATVDDEGNITAVGAGTATISLNSTNVGTTLATCTVTVADPASSNAVTAASNSSSSSSSLSNSSSGSSSSSLSSSSSDSSSSSSSTTVKKTSIKKLTKKSKGFKVTWKKKSSVTGYQVQYATNKKFTKNKKTVTIKKASTTSKTIKNLKSKKTYYVRVRTYKTVNGKKVYSNWSTVKKVKTK